MFRSDWRRYARTLLRDTIAIWRAMRDRRVPIQAKVVAVLSALYVILPVDIIPDFVPVAGWLDDLVIAPLLAHLAAKIAPQDVMARYRGEADTLLHRWGPKLTKGIFIFVVLWLILASIGGWMAARSIRGDSEAAASMTTGKPAGQDERERIIRERFSLFGE